MFCLNSYLFSLLLAATIPFVLYQAWLTVPNAHNPASSSARRENIWSDLTERESIDLIRWLHGPSSGLNLTAVRAATHADDILLVAELLRPNKTDAVAFLDRSGPAPLRFARVTVKRNSVEPPDVAEYLVGPLGHSSQTIEPLRFVYNSGRSATVNPAADVVALSRWMDEVALEVADIIDDLLRRPLHGQTQDGAGQDVLEPSSNDQTFIEDGRVMRWVTFFPVSDASTLLPQGLYFKADTTGRDPAQWKVVMWLYNGITYPSIKEFRAAWQSSGFEKLESGIDGTWTALEPDLPPNNEEYSTNAPPNVLQPHGSRIKLDRAQSFVSWMGFSFNFAFSQVNGVALYDMRLDGERIMYELSLQEAMAHYAGNDPIQSSTAFLDSLFGVGTQVAALVPGYDCPTYAHFFNVSYHRMETTYRRPGALCIFESPTDYPLQRHSRGRAVTSFTNSVLIVRTIAVVGNYDYLVDYIMYLDGAVEVKVRASGYIQGAFYRNNTGYGYRVHEALSSSIHDHVLNFKADIDITGGAQNSLAKLTVAEKVVEYPWSAPRNTMVLERTVVEEECAVNWPANSASMYVITGETNHLGEKRGYRVMPGTGVGSPAHLTMQNSSLLLRAAEWAKHDVFFTRQKDTEPRSAVPANALSPGDPLVDFGRFLDGESLVDQDIVVWFNLGMHHVPHTGDIPNTLMTTSASSVMFAPHNFHVRDRSRAMTSGVRVDVKGAGRYNATYFGAPQGDLGAFVPSVRPVRKFPTNDSELAL
ncbi:copper amine oxidase [Cercophora scortea]|uniref:Amine oxidase n=1 Tax=Cercophora scortea TaxID=314031 RepID=A0AAE0M3H4_9PEZI|nr:copper amine oxidase [Cercophora scortea]